KVFLAFGRASVPATLTARTDQTITDPRRLEEELGIVRRRGFATAIDELELGLAAIAAPVRGARGDVVAALSVSGPTLRITPARIAELRTILIAEGRALSRRLGHDEQGDEAA
ncbi:MAG TPA: IclR family transcriptional regulator C-terminal domain-containing protein, partial [Solirubrobacteraceae bacterium]